MLVAGCLALRRRLMDLSLSLSGRVSGCFGNDREMSREPEARFARAGAAAYLPKTRDLTSVDIKGLTQVYFVWKLL